MPARAPEIVRANPATLELLTRVAAGFGPLLGEVVFLGGATVGLLLTDEEAAQPRPTGDVDVVVQVATAIDYQTRVRDRLRAQNFVEDASDRAPLCRWIFDGIKVDVMPPDGAVLGLRSRWFRVALAQARDFRRSSTVARRSWRRCATAIRLCAATSPRRFGRFGAIAIFATAWRATSATTDTAGCRRSKHGSRRSPRCNQPRR
jgi:hypothetical protein